MSKFAKLEKVHDDRQPCRCDEQNWRINFTPENRAGYCFKVALRHTGTQEVTEIEVDSKFYQRDELGPCRKNVISRKRNFKRIFQFLQRYSNSRKKF